MNSAKAFSYAISGSFNETQINNYSDYVHRAADSFAAAGGWLAEQAARTKDSINEFVNSRAWEMSKRMLNNQDGEYVPRFEYGYLGSISGLQSAQGFMRDIVMAHPEMMRLYKEGEIVGYEGEFGTWCNGIKEENLVWRRMWNGVLNVETIDDKAHLKHTHFFDSVGTTMSFRDRVNSHKTHHAIDYHMAKSLFDLTSAEGALMKSHQPPPEASEEPST